VQKPEAHSSFVLHVEPRILRPQLPFMHCTPMAQSAFVVHAAKQSCLVVSHEYGTHTFESLVAHVPLPSHVFMFVTAAPSHVPAWQTVPMTYLRHAP
jgi:hypothetical protein